MRTARIVLALAAVLATGAPALADGVDDLAAGDGPDRPTWTIDAGTVARWYGDSSAASLTPNAQFGPRITIGRRMLGLGGPFGGLALGAFVRIAGGTSDGTLFQTLDTRISQSAFTAGARLDLRLWRGLGATAHVDLGAARTTTMIGDELGAMAPVDDVAWGMIGTASLGATYDLVFRRHFSVGLGVDVGYTLASAVTVHAIPRTRPEDDLSIPTVFASLGELDTRGFTTAFSLRGGF